MISFVGKIPSYGHRTAQRSVHYYLSTLPKLLTFITLELFFPLSYTLSTELTKGIWDILDAKSGESISVTADSEGDGNEVDVEEDAIDNAGVGCDAAPSSSSSATDKPRLFCEFYAHVIKS